MTLANKVSLANHLQTKHYKGHAPPAVTTAILEANPTYFSSDVRLCTGCLLPFGSNRSATSCGRCPVTAPNLDTTPTTAPQAHWQSTHGFVDDPPTLADTFASSRPVRTIRHIPPQARTAVALALAHILDAVVAHNRPRDLDLLFAFPGLVLAPQRHTSKRNPLSARIVKQLDNLKANRFPTTGAARSEDPEFKTADARLTGLLDQGCLGKAAKFLLNSEPAPCNGDTLRKLQEKHPQGPALTPPPPVSATSLRAANTSEVRDALKTFPKDTACGISGMRSTHLLDCCRAPGGDRLLTSLTDFVNLCLQGSLNQYAQQYFCGARLIALRKDDGDVRPIAIGEILRRLVAKVLLNISPEVVSVVGLHQFGLAPLGSEQIIHSLRSMIHNSTDESLRIHLVDWKNAFNSIDRHALLQRVAEETPTLLPFVAYCYCNPSSLLFEHHVIASASGVQQGDPLGPLLFCIGLAPLLEAIITEIPEATSKWYLDDGTVVVKASESATLMKVLQEVGGPLGLVLNTEKTTVHSLADNFKTLGAAFGSPDFISTYAHRKLGKVFVTLKGIAGLRDPHYAFTLLRLCFSFQRAVFLCRTTPPSLIKQALTQFDMEIMATFCKITGVVNLDPARLRLPISKGGFGLRSPTQHSPAAYSASVIGCAKHGGWDSSLSPELTLSVSSLEEKLGAPLPSEPSQHALSSALDAMAFNKLYDRSSEEEKVILLSCSAPKASKFWSAIPNKAFWHLAPSSFRIAVRHRLGCVSTSGIPCPICKKAQLDPFGRHLLTHRKYQIHNAVRNATAAFTSAAHIPSVTEPAFASSHRAGNHFRPADLFIRSLRPLSSTSSTCIDFAVTNPLRLKRYKTSSRVQCAAASSYASKEKVNVDYFNLCIANDFDYRPVVLEHYGAIDPTGMETLDEIVAVHASNNNLPVSLSDHYLYTAISFSLIGEIAFSLLNASVLSGVHSPSQ
jgi:hypothetical protein